jgi:hypothetical protein
LHIRACELLVVEAATLYSEYGETIVHYQTLCEERCNNNNKLTYLMFPDHSPFPLARISQGVGWPFSASPSLPVTPFFPLTGHSAAIVDWTISYQSITPAKNIKPITVKHLIVMLLSSLRSEGVNKEEEVTPKRTGKERLEYLKNATQSGFALIRPKKAHRLLLRPEIFGEMLFKIHKRFNAEIWTRCVTGMLDQSRIKWEDFQNIMNGKKVVLQHTVADLGVATMPTLVLLNGTSSFSAEELWGSENAAPPRVLRIVKKPDNEGYEVLDVLFNNLFDERVELEEFKLQTIADVVCFLMFKFSAKGDTVYGIGDSISLHVATFSILLGRECVSVHNKATPLFVSWSEDPAFVGLKELARGKNFLSVADDDAFNVGDFIFDGAFVGSQVAGVDLSFLLKNSITVVIDLSNNYLMCYKVRKWFPSNIRIFSYPGINDVSVFVLIIIK